MKVFVERKGLTTAELWRGFHDLADDWLWAAGRNLKGRPSTVQPHGRPPRIVYGCLKPSKSDWSGFKMDPAHQTLLALARRIGELIRLIKARPDESHHAHSALAAVQKSSRRVREDLASAHFLEGWFHADLEPGTAQGREMLENCEARLKAAVDQHLRDIQASRAASWARWCQDQLQGSGAAICKWIRAKHTMAVTAAQVGDGLGDFEMHPGKVADACLDEWARVWKAQPGTPEENSSPQHGWRACRTSRSPRSPCQKSGARCGKLRGQAEASTGGPGLSWQALPDTGLAILAKIFAAAELDGGFPSCGGLNTVEVLLDKGAGTAATQQRNIGILPRLYFGSGAPRGAEWCAPGGPR